MLRRLVVLATILFSASSCLAAAPGTRAECEAAGGVWGRFGVRQQELCNLPAPDAGKACKDSSDCAAACVAPDAAVVGSTADGRCYARMLLLGTCLKHVSKGVVEPALCTD
jgi:hypothetical protein